MPPGVSRTGPCLSSHSTNSGSPRAATARPRSPSTLKTWPYAAPHRRNALSRIASNTGARLPGEALMTCKTSAVAVCCSNASRIGEQPRILRRDDRLRREVLQQRDLLVRERPDVLAVGGQNAEKRIVFDKWHKNA